MANTWFLYPIKILFYFLTNSKILSKIKISEYYLFVSRTNLTYAASFSIKVNLHLIQLKFKNIIRVCMLTFLQYSNFKARFERF